MSISHNSSNSGPDLEPNPGEEVRLPVWMKVPLKFDIPGDSPSRRVRAALGKSRLRTVCEEASCPNQGHCWSQGTATFLIMGDRCTRNCRFCDINTARPLPLDCDEPARVARSAAELKLRHIVITSVDRDELSDCGSDHFARTIEETRRRNPTAALEVLIPDFKGRLENLERIWAAGPDIINHNVETVPSLYSKICPQSDYDVSLRVLRLSAKRGFTVKSGLILGLGEQLAEIEQVMKDLREAQTAMLTLGQYLQPTKDHYPLQKYVAAEEFARLKARAYELGFVHVESGPLVRSSYHAGEGQERIFQLAQSAEIEKNDGKAPGS